MRCKHRDIPAVFRVPFGPWLIPIVGALLCMLLLANTTKGTLVRFGVWLVIGHIVYFSHGFRHAKNRPQKREDSEISAIELASTTETLATDLSPEENSEQQTAEEKPVGDES